MRVLFVEDDVKITDALKEMCEYEGIESDLVNDGETGLSLALSSIYDMIVLDIMLPDFSGLEILQALRKHGISCPVLILSAKGEIEDKVQALDLGADDYLVKPFSAKELFARIRALSRRSGSEFEGDRHIVYGKVAFNLNRKSIVFDGQEKKLSKKEARILEILLRNHDATVKRDYIIDEVWGTQPDGSSSKENNVEIYIYNLRKKLENSGLIIDTIRGVGYVLRRV